MACSLEYTHVWTCIWLLTSRTIPREYDAIYTEPMLTPVANKVLEHTVHLLELERVMFLRRERVAREDDCGAGLAGEVFY